MKRGITLHQLMNDGFFEWMLSKNPDVTIDHLIEHPELVFEFYKQKKGQA